MACIVYSMNFVTKHLNDICILSKFRGCIQRNVTNKGEGNTFGNKDNGKEAITRRSLSITS